MKRLFALVLVLTMLAGCGPKTPTETTVAPTESVTAPTEAPTTEPEKSLLDGAKPWLGNDRLLELPLEQLQREDIYYDMTGVLGDRLLMTAARSRVLEPESEEGEYSYEIAGMEYLLLDLRTGETAAELTLDGPNYVMPQILDDEIVLCDEMAGRIGIYDRDLKLLREYSVEPDDGDWYLGRRDGDDVLYRFGYEQDCVAENLVTGQKESVIRKHPGLWPDGVHEEALYVTRVQPDGTLQHITLDLHDGHQTQLPFAGQIFQPQHVGDTWMCLKSGTAGGYLLCRDGETRVIALENRSLWLMEEDRLLVSDGVELKLYDGQGRLLDGCRIGEETQENWLCDVRTCACYDGCLLTVSNESGGRNLLLWQPDTEPEEGQDLEFRPQESEPKLPRGGAVSDALYDRAEQIGEQFGVEIRIADQCDTADVSYTVDFCDDEELLNHALDVLEQSMAAYPEGFFRQFRWGYVTKLRIQITGSIYSGDTYTIGSGCSGYANQRDTVCEVVVDANSIHNFVLAHEFSHLIDRKLQWDADCRDDSDYSEEKWLSLNPEGFAYLNDYNAYPDRFEDESMMTWFWTPYATVNPTEDRATMMECAVGIPWAYDEAPGMQAKLRYYSACIRDCFDTTGWPEHTVWEQVMYEWEEKAA